MWIFTDTGFVSAVADRDNNDQLIVRSRDRASLEPLAALDGDQILVGIGSDYRYRILCSRETFTRWVTEQATAIDYPNFKDEVAKVDPERAAVYMGVWSELRKLQERE